ncbi:type II toxin-antitoxin system RelE/ParE family toxin [Mesorhizobium sp. IMUNJ 23232]|uniref:type II toxin-antitoxin system RelE/ParE family toxin n=1 Tax=Mesorhizobium sp. IMUNJ 23232 TaxID=3376064 RepID=UPI003789F8A5
MRILFLAQAKRDLRWFKRYYTDTFPEGSRKADAQFVRAQRLLLTNPHIGHPSEKVDGARELHLQRTPFTFIYRPFSDRIEILRVIDERSDWLPPVE